MRIKSLEMSGFKSFSDRTVILFEEGITGVVGPNGCGKSNIVDAIRWVMGEMSAKHLRGSAMEDVIFNGCETRPAVGMAQVFLTFDNADGRAPAEYASYSEIQVGRRLYRSGESEYFINKTICRLKDIVELFLGTGVGTKAYSIVEQGTVGSIISSKPEDRRTLIEEAAGISKFKARKEAALRKMDSTRSNLARLTDVLSELTRQINSLNRQAKKAERYKRINDELAERELAVASTRYRELRQELTDLEGDSTRLNEMETAAQAELGQLEADLESAKLSLAEVEGQLDGVQQQLYSVQQQIRLAEAGIEHRTQERTATARRRDELDQELVDLRERRADIDRRIEAANTALARADLQLAGSTSVVVTLEEKVAGVRGQHGEMVAECEQLAAAISSDGEAIANFEATLTQLERRHVDLNGRVARDQSQIDAIDRRRKQIDGELTERERELAGAKQLKFKLEGESETAAATLVQQREALSGAEEQFQCVRSEESDVRSKLESLRELRKNLEGYKEGVKAVLERTDTDGEKLSGVMGTVGDLLETEPEYEQALAAVLGEKLQYVVVQSQSAGVEAIEYLQQAARGRGTFVPLTLRADAASEGVPSGEGVVGAMTDVVRFSDDHRLIAQHLLRDVVLVEDLPRALALWETGSSSQTFVTRDGSVVDATGVISGGDGGGVEEQLIAQKRRTKELEERLSVLRGQRTAAEGEVLRRSEQVKHLEEQVEAIRRDAHGEELKLLGRQRDFEHLKSEHDRLDQERDQLTVETAALAEELAGIEHEQTDSRMRLTQHTTDRETARARLQEAQASARMLADELSREEGGLIDLKVDLAQAEERQTAAARELEGLVRTKVETILGIDRRENDRRVAECRAVVLAREIEALRAELDLAIRSIGKLKESQRVLHDRFESGQTSMRDRELAIREARGRHDEARSRFHEVELKLTEERGRATYLIDSIRERYHMELTQVWERYARDDIDLDAEEVAVHELKESLEKIGSVNVDAIEEYEELKVRHEFLERQHGDLTASLENLSKAIAKINRTSRARFRRAFDAVNEQFVILFPKLFKGGKAKLLLTDEENLLETGVEIIAQPPGKKLQSITLLSGGEKALTAVALVFSIFLIKPSPFCLLDEVDAPLDDANIDRFNDLIRSMTPHSQFILITHNKRTMELADLLYGVTMEEAGVSKMVSVRLGNDKKKGEEEPAVA